MAVIDELDTDIHPLLIPELFRWFYDTERNPKGAQLLFTAHNPAILDELEKEQVLFFRKAGWQTDSHLWRARNQRAAPRAEPDEKIPLRRTWGCSAYRLIHAGDKHQNAGTILRGC